MRIFVPMRRSGTGVHNNRNRSSNRKRTPSPCTVDMWRICLLRVTSVRLTTWSSRRVGRVSLRGTLVLWRMCLGSSALRRSYQLVSGSAIATLGDAAQTAAVALPHDLSGVAAEGSRMRDAFLQ